MQIGQTVEVQVIRYNAENQRISLGMKQLESDPWQGIAAKYKVGTLVKGRVNNITDYGAFVELEAGIEGLVHVSEMSWTKKNVHPGKIVSTSQEVDVMVLEVDQDKRRISLGLKQTQESPWKQFAQDHKAGDELEGEIRNITEFGMFIGLPGDIDGMVHLSDISYTDDGEEALKAYQKGGMAKVKILEIDADKERVALGIKQLQPAPAGMSEKSVAPREFTSTTGAAPAAGGAAPNQSGQPRKGDVVTCTITGVSERGVEVSIGEGIEGLIKKADLSRERSEQRPDRFAVGEKVDAKIVDTGGRKLGLSIKQREIDEDKAALDAFGSSDSGASLGDILGAALNKGGPATEAKAEKAPAKKPAAKKKKDEAEEEAGE